MTNQADAESKKERNWKLPIPVQLLFCVGLAFLLWIFQALSQNHRAEIRVNLDWGEVPEGKALMHSLPEEAFFEVEGIGWQLFYDILQTRTIHLDLNRFGDHDLVISNRNVELFSNDLSRNLRLNRIRPDSILIDLDQFMEKKVPIEIPSRLEFARGYGQSGPLLLEPDSVLVKGPRSLVVPLRRWTAEALEKDNIESDQSGRLKLEDSPSEMLEVSHRQVNYSLPVDVFTEGKFSLEIANMEDAPDSLLSVQINRVEVFFQAPLGSFDQIKASDFRVEALWEELEDLPNQSPHRVRLKLINQAPGVRALRLEPRELEFYVLGNEEEAIEESPEAQ
jgi:hypothetical protein